MKKRLIISIIVTILTVFLSNKLWLNFKPMQVGIDIRGSKECAIDAILNRRNDDKFKKIKHQIKYADIKDAELVTIDVNRAKCIKRLRLVINFQHLNDNDWLVINKILLGNKKVIEDFQNFEVSGADVLSNHGSLKLKPAEKTVTITYTKPLHVTTSIEIDFYLLIIIAILTFLLSYKLSSYIADFSSVKGKSRVDIIFLTIFFAFLFVPMSYIDNDEISERENRTLARWYPLITDKNEINFDFGKNFNDWFNDRFNMRNSFQKMHSSIISCFYRDFYEGQNIIYNKKENFAFNKSSSSMGVFLNNNLYTEEEISRIYENAKELQKYCENHNIKLYIVLSNDKESIYPEYYPSYYTPQNNKSRLEQLKEIFAKVPQLRVVSLSENIMNAKKEGMIFEPYDTHLNAKGAYIEYASIIKEISNDFRNLKPVDFSGTEEIKLERKCDTLPPDKYVTEEYLYKSNTVPKNRHFYIKNYISMDGVGYLEYINNYAKNKLKVIIAGDSFHLEYKDLLAETFYSVKSLNFGNGMDFVLNDSLKQYIYDEKPDILILESTERFLRRFVDLSDFMDICDRKYRSK